MSKEYKKQFTRKELQMASTHEKRFHITINWELQVKSTMRYSSSLVWHSRTHACIKAYTYIHIYKKCYNIKL